jgi:DHA1 family bicyclomycin/chloramphenicol resistance-like MFS transporter
MGEREFIVLLSLLMALTALAIDMMLPAFGRMRADLGLAEGSSALAPVVSAFFIGLGAGQLVWGPLSDALGRKPVLHVGLAIYGVAALVAAASDSLTWLLLFRLAAGFGAGAIRVVALGTVRDRFRGQAMARLMSYVMAVFILVPVVAPSLGALVLSIGSWHAIFTTLALAALVAAAWSRRLPETLPPEGRLPLDVDRLARAMRVVVGDRFAMGLTIAGTAAFGFFATYLATSELIIGEVFGLGDWFPLIFGGSALALGASLLLNPRMLDRVGLRPWLHVIVSAYLAAAALLAGIAVATGGTPSFVLYALGLLPVLFVQGFMIPNLNAAAMIPMGHVAGTAAAIIGSISTLGGALIGASVDVTYDGTVVPLALTALLMATLGYAAYRWADAVWVRSTARDVELPA